MLSSVTIFFAGHSDRQQIVKLVGSGTHLAEQFLAYGYSSCVQLLKLALCQSFSVAAGWEDDTAELYLSSGWLRANHSVPW